MAKVSKSGEKERQGIKKLSFNIPACWVIVGLAGPKMD
jgi:hypothetical protein